MLAIAGPTWARCLKNTTWVLMYILAVAVQAADWAPAATISPEDIVAASDGVLERPDIALDVEETIFRIRALELGWDIGGEVFQPTDPSLIPTGPDNRKVGLYVLHGGASDHRTQRRLARLLAGKFGFKVVTMSYPGRLYLLDESRDWPGEPIRNDGTVRMPIWSRDALIADDQYTVLEDRAHPGRYARYGTLTFACAKEGTEFWDRMAAWPGAFEEGGREFLRRELPADEYSIYAFGHSTGGPFVHMLSQRVENLVGVVAMESSPFGYIAGERIKPAIWDDVPFQCLRIRTWRDAAKYVGPEAYFNEGAEALLRLPELMEEVFERWNGGNHYPRFKAENMIHFNATPALEAAALATATRLELNPGDTEALVTRYLGYVRELSGKGTKPVPPVLMGATSASRGYTREVYETIVLPMFAAMDPPPKTGFVSFEGGRHSFGAPAPGLPMGLYPAVAQLWHDAIQGGFFLDDGTKVP